MALDVIANPAVGGVAGVAAGTPVCRAALPGTGPGGAALDATCVPYNIFTAGGEDWDNAKKGFTRDCAFSKFDDDFAFSSSGDRWTITLEQVVGGNASTSDVDPNAFPAG